MNRRLTFRILPACCGLVLTVGCDFAARRIDVPIRIEEPTGVDRTYWPVSIGLPFPPGQLKGVGHLAVLDPAGGLLLTQPRPTTWYRDGSIAWAYVQFPATMKAQTADMWRLVSLDQNALANTPAVKRKLFPPPDSLKVSQTDTHIDIDTGRISLRIAKAPFTLFSRVSVGNRTVVQAGKEDGLTIVDEKGETFRSAWGRKPTVMIEQRGSVCVVVRIDGDHRSKDGRPLFDYSARIHAFVNQDFVRVDYTFTNTADADITKIKEMVLKTSLAGSGLFRGLTADYKVDKFYEFAEPFFILQQKPDVTYGVFAGADIFKNDGTQIQGLGYETEARARWWVNAANEQGGVTTALYQMLENYPKKLLASPDGIEVHLWPTEGGTLEFHQGMAKTHTVYFQFQTADADKRDLRANAIRMIEPVIPWSPAYIRTSPTDSGDSLLSRIPSYMPDRIPNIERGLRKAYVSWESGGLARGMIDFGDTYYGGSGPRGSFMANCAYDFPLTTYQQWARTGERRYFLGAQAAALHMMDIDTVHHTTHEPAEFGGIRIHGPRHVQYNAEGFENCSVAPNHIWIDGLMLHSQMTGDLRGIQTAYGVGESMLKMSDKGWLTPPYIQSWHGVRNSAWPAVAFVTLYQTTHEDRFLAAARKIVYALKDFQQPDGSFPMVLGFYQGSAPLQSSIAMIALMRYHQCTGDPVVRDLFLRGLDSILRDLRFPDGEFMYITAPDYRSGCTFPVEAFGYGYALTGDRRYLTAVWPNLRSVLLGYLQSRVSVQGEGALCYDWRGLFSYLYWGRRAGILEDVHE
jgi:hypothetical protein